MNELERSLMTISCRDCDFIPKIEGAGQVVERDGIRLQRMHNGIEVLYGGYHGEWMAHVIRGLRGHHEPQEEAVFFQLLRYVRNRTLIVELGCFWSYYSCWFLKEIPDSRALCIEPDPEHLTVGQRNLELNGFATRAATFNALIGATAEDEREVVTASGAGVAIPVLDGAQTIRMAGGPIELLHFDIQGAELPFLSSFTSQLARSNLRFVMLSTHHSSISGSSHTHTDCVERLLELGASILVEHDVSESYSGDGLIVASFYPSDRDLEFPEISRNRTGARLFEAG